MQAKEGIGLGIQPGYWERRNEKSNLKITAFGSNFNLENVNDRGQVAFISADTGNQEEGHRQCHQGDEGHDACWWSVSDEHWVLSN